ncbi:MAG TPA: RNB domain-containing ribonuclease [Pyrinomonadaceae bacterium]|nr:RNB domain-containing ribonuclease [Pyrinomonadaceae bacterium]
MTRNQSHSARLDLSAVARNAMIEAGFVPDVPASALAELHQLEQDAHSANPSHSTRDLRNLTWSSIDNQQSRDLDQVEFAEALPNGDIRVMVGIADVDALVQKRGAIDDHAEENATSVYTGFKTFAMLPEQLSTDMTSLVRDADRASIVVALIVDSDGQAKTEAVYSALLHNYAKLSYESVAAWLDDDASTPTEFAGVAGLEDQLRLQLEVAGRLRKLRKQRGALELDTIQTTPVLDDAGQVASLGVSARNSATDIIENLMIATNVAIAQFLEAKKLPSIRRIVRTPKQWPRIVELARDLGEKLPSEPNSLALAEFIARRKQADPLHFQDLSLSIVKLLGPGEYVVQTATGQSEGHFGLAVSDYTHSTAPNRRYADLITQRLLKASIAGSASPYDEKELAEIAEHCTEREDAARKVERKMRKVAAALLLENRIGDQFDAIVTGVTPRGTFARTLNPPVDGLIARGEQGLRVGDKIRVKLLSTDPARGYIDFARNAF